VSIWELAQQEFACIFSIIVIKPPLGFYVFDFGLKPEDCFVVCCLIVLSSDFIVSNLISEFVFGRGLAIGFI